MKTTKGDFEKFKNTAFLCLDVYGLKGWHITFIHEKLEGLYACIRINMEGRHAILVLSTEWPDNENAGWEGPEYSGRHEAIHLLLARLVYLAGCRFLTCDELQNEEERLVRVLEKILPPAGL